MRLVVPRGPLQLGAGFAWMHVSVTQGRPDLLASSLRTRTHHLAALIHTLSETLPTLGRPVVAGCSQGALLTFSLALHRPDVVGRAFPLAAWVPPGLMPSAPVAAELRVPMRSVHGTDDPVIPIGPTREVVAMLRALEWEVELVEFEGVGHVLSPEMNATFEAWVEQALGEQAPALTGRGLGLAGPEDETYAPWEPLEQETIEAIEQLEAQEAAPSATGDAAAQDDTAGVAENGTERNGTSDEDVDASPESD
jgi:predicted esterase